jgi:hypothetical protein
MRDVVEERPRTLLEQAVAVVAYAEVRAILLSWAGARWDPIARAWAAVRDVVQYGGAVATDLVPRAQAVLRADSRAMLEPIIASRGVWPFRRAIAPGQIGSVDGVEQIFHRAAADAWQSRRDDAGTLVAAIGIADFIWNHLAESRRPTAGHPPR